MKSYRIQHHAADNPEDDSYAYKSHTSEDRENMLEVQKQGWEPPVWLDVTRQVITPLVFVAQLITSASSNRTPCLVRHHLINRVRR